MGTLADSIAATHPALMRRALKMTQVQDQAEDLAAEAITRALTHQAQFRPGTNLSAWCFVIMRNAYFNSARRNKFAGGSVDDLPESTWATPETQSAYVELKQTLAAIEKLPSMYRDALLQVASGASYDDAAEALKVPSGTLKTWIRRGRKALLEALA